MQQAYEYMHIFERSDIVWVKENHNKCPLDLYTFQTLLLYIILIFHSGKETMWSTTFKFVCKRLSHHCFIFDYPRWMSWANDLDFLLNLPEFGEEARAGADRRGQHGASAKDGANGQRGAHRGFVKSRAASSVLPETRLLQQNPRRHAAHLQTWRCGKQCWWFQNAAVPTAPHSVTPGLLQQLFYLLSLHVSAVEWES